MRGLVSPTDLEMETAEADDMVRKRHFVPFTQSRAEGVSFTRDEVEFIVSKCNVWFCCSAVLYLKIACFESPI